MSTTTQILFNSPALHSLKREQLVKLCKIHSLRASGKNVELIQRLKQHAQELPKDSPLSMAVRAEENGLTSHGGNGQTTQQEGDNDRSDSNNVGYRSAMPRQSEQWEVVMDSIAEEDEGSSQGTLSSLRTIGNGAKATGEFGTGSSKSSTVGSSIKALATSLGLKRGNVSKSTASSSKSSIISASQSETVCSTNDELTQTSTPYSALPASAAVPELQPPLAFNPSRMSMNGFLADGETPLPGHALRPGIPAPQNARLSLGLGLGAPSTPTRRTEPTTTIRLVANSYDEPSMNSTFYSTAGGGTPQLKPFETTFDLVMGSPAPVSHWPNLDVDMGSIYPKLTFSDLPPSLPPASPSCQPQSTNSLDQSRKEASSLPGSITNATRKRGGLAAPSPEPFIFGSPLPQHRVSNAQFRTAAASVLEEMNKRLLDEGVEGVDVGLVNRLHPGAHKDQELESREVKPLPSRPQGQITEKFDALHEEQFKKMEGIDGLLKRRAERGSPKKEDAEPIQVGKKRKSGVIDDGPRRPYAVTSRVSGTRVISNGRRAKALPGAFGPDDGDDDEDEPELNSERAGKRIRVSSNPLNNAVEVGDNANNDNDDDEDKQFKERQREAVKRKLEQNKARRRSSAAPGALNGRRSGRLSGRVSGVLAKPKPKASKFGFLSSAKSLVQSVWNRGKSANSAAQASSSVPKPSAQASKIAEKPKAPSLLVKKAAVAPAKATATAATATSSRLPPPKANDRDASNGQLKGSIASSARSRSPIPSFGVARSTRSSIMSNPPSGTQTSRNSIMSGSAAASRKGSIAGTTNSRLSATNVTSIGTRGPSTPSANGAVGSMGLRKALNVPAGSTSNASSTSSRLSSATGRTSNTGSSSSRLSTSSRLLAPTASSLAKMNNRNSIAGLKAVAERPQQQPPAATPITNRIPRGPEALGAITNSPAIQVKPAGPFSPTPGKIFSRPLQLPSGIPTPMKKRTTGLDGEAPTNANGAPGLGRQRTLSGRKPRISRSKVIARLASQRAAGAGGSSGVSSIASKPGGRTRSSLGAKVQRASLTGAKSRVSSGGNVMLSAKKARQSEYMRRRSRVGAWATPGESNAMDVDG